MVHSFQKDQLRVEQYATRKEMGDAAAKTAIEAVVRAQGEKDQICILFAAAPSQNEFLTTLTESDQIDWSKITALQLDEYMGFDPEAPQGFARFLYDRVFSKVPIGNCQMFRCDCPDIEEERLRYTRLFADYPPDIAFIGIGENTHIAFNDPDKCSFGDPEMVRTVELAPESREQQVNDGCFKTLADVPEIALTLTVPAIMAAKQIFCMVPASSKAKAIYETLNTPHIGEHCPASILRTHPNATLYLDNDSASLL